MNWGGKADVKSTIVYPKAPPFMQRTIKLHKSINIEKLLEHPEIEWDQESKKPIRLWTKDGIIWVHSKKCIQISHVKNPDVLDELEKFIHSIVCNNEKRTWIDWLRVRCLSIG